MVNITRNILLLEHGKDILLSSELRHLLSVVDASPDKAIPAILTHHLGRSLGHLLDTPLSGLGVKGELGNTKGSVKDLPELCLAELNGVDRLMHLLQVPGNHIM